ncbi:phage tail protein, partial [Mameliella alba]|nr:phage tail protein [Mameliella alba]
MTRIPVFFLALAVLFLGAEPAAADPIGAAIAAVGSWFAGLGVVGQALVRLAVGLVLSKLAEARLKTPEAQSGLKTEATLTGGDNSEGFILGRYATGGVFAAPPLSWGTRRAHLVYVIDLGAFTGQTVERIFVNGEPQTWGGVFDPDGRGERNAGGSYDKRIWYRFNDGSQTEADPYLIDKLGADPDFPWRADMIGRGRAHLVMTFFFDKDGKSRFSGLPTVRVEVQGIPLYDPRKDSSAGGSGAHRWADPATWEQSDNPAVMIYNILRGIALPGGAVWGGRASAEDLPLAVWAAAMNECDVSVLTEGGATEPQYRAGAEVRVGDDEPAAVIEELLASCSGELVEEGGAWFIHVGAPALPSYYLTDDDVIVSAPQELEPWPGIAQTVNGVSITYPEPAMAWETKDAPAILRPDLEAEDDGRRQVTSLSLRSCPYPVQAQRLGKAYLNDARRFRVHRLTLPPDAAHVPPLATISWTSARNGYTAKLFEIQKKQVQLRTLLTQVAIRERDPGDYSWSAADQLPSEIPPVLVSVPDPYQLEGLAIVGAEIGDGADARRAAVLATWAAADLEGVEYQVRLPGGEVIAQGTAPADGARLVISQGILPACAYEARLRPTGGDGLFNWSAWVSLLTPDTRLTSEDFESALANKIDQAFDRHDAALAEATGVVAELRDAAIASLGPLSAPESLADQLPRLETGLEEAYQRLMALEWSQFTTGQTLAGAGIFVDSDSGEVRITAFERAEARVSTVEINLSAVEAALELSASVAYVDNAISAAISAAILDPSQIPLIGDLELRVSNAELALDAAEGQITTLTDTLTVSGGLVTMATVTQSLDSLAGEIAQKVAQADFDAAEARISTAETSISALGDVAQITDAVEATAQQELDNAEAAQRSIAELWQRWTGDSAARSASAQGRRDLAARVEEGLEAEAAERFNLAAQQAATATTLAEERIARAGGDEALASSLANLAATLAAAEGEIVGNAAAISGLDTRVTDAEGLITSQASSITSLQSGVTAAQGAADAAQAAADGAQGAADGNAAAISGLDTRVTDAEGLITSQASSITSLQSAVNGNAGAISNLQTTKVDGAGAVAAVEQEIAADFGSLAALAQEVTTVKATSDGLSAAYVLRLNAGGASAG